MQQILLAVRPRAVFQPKKKSSDNRVGEWVERLSAQGGRTKLAMAEKASEPAQAALQTYS